MSEPHTWATLPLPPSDNAAHRTGQGRRYSAAAYKAWQDEAGKTLMVARSQGLVKPIREGWFHVEIQAPAGMRADTPNINKAVHDLLHRCGVTPDDRWMWSQLTERCARVSPGTCVVRTWPVFETHAEGVSQDVPA